MAGLTTKTNSMITSSPVSPFILALRPSLGSSAPLLLVAFSARPPTPHPAASFQSFFRSDAIAAVHGCPCSRVCAEAVARVGGIVGGAGLQRPSNRAPELAEALFNPPGRRFRLSLVGFGVMPDPDMLPRQLLAHAAAELPPRRLCAMLSDRDITFDIAQLLELLQLGLEEASFYALPMQTLVRTS